MTRKQKKKLVIAAVAAASAAVAALLLFFKLIPDHHYREAERAYAGADYARAAEAFAALGGYGDAAERKLDAYCRLGGVLLDNGDWQAAIDAYAAAEGFGDSQSGIAECRYRMADSLRQSGMYEQAYDLYTDILSYKDVRQILSADENLSGIGLSRLSASMTSGNIVKLGLYDQDGNAENGPEEIEWIVLDVSGDDALLLSRNVLASMMFDSPPFHDWEGSRCREWLNRHFYYDAFAAAERARIKTVDTPEGSRDRVFLLSCEEAERYLSQSAGGPVHASKTVLDSIRDKTDENWGWRLRTPGTDGYTTAYVTETGIDYKGFPVDTYAFSLNGGRSWKYIGIRPALVFSLSGASDTLASPDGGDWQGSLFIMDRKNEEKVRSAAEIPEGPLRAADLAGIERIDLEGHESASLLPMMTGLKELVLKGSHFNKRMDLNILSGLTDLRYLSITDAELTDLNDLSGLKNLEELDLSGCHVLSVEGISGLAGLRKLRLSALDAGNISELGSLANLEELTLNHCTDEQFRVIASLGKLVSLECRAGWGDKYRVTDLSPIRELNRLERLVIRYQGITDVEPLSGLVRLTELDITGNPVSNVEVLSDLPNLTVTGIE